MPLYTRERTFVLAICQGNLKKCLGGGGGEGGKGRVDMEFNFLTSMSDQ